MIDDYQAQLEADLADYEKAFEEAQEEIVHAQDWAERCKHRRDAAFKRLQDYLTYNQ